MIVNGADVPPLSFPGLFGGHGILESRRLLTAMRHSNLKAIALNRLPPGSSIGRHQHVGEEDFYFCLSGQGLVTDNIQEHPFTPGTLQITRDGEYQGLRNIGTADLVFLAGLVLTSRPTPSRPRAIRSRKP